MRILATAVTVLSLSIVVAATYSKAQAHARSGSIVSEIVELRNEQNAERFDRILNVVVRELKTIQESFNPVMWLGGIAAVMGTVSLVVICIKRRTEIV